jgi:hypothetical protein
MTFPTTAIPTTNLSSSTADPSQARANLLTAVEYINTIIDEKNTASGVVVLQGDGTIDATLMPTTLAPTGQLTLAPTNTIVKVEDILRLQGIPSNVLKNLTDVAAGDIALSTDADGGDPAICFYDGTEWKYLPQASLTTVA